MGVRRDDENSQRRNLAVAGRLCLFFALGILGFDLDDDTDRIPQTDSHELAERVGHRSGEESSSPLLREMFEQASQRRGKAEVEEAVIKGHDNVSAGLPMGVKALPRAVQASTAKRNAPVRLVHDEHLEPARIANSCPGPSTDAGLAFALLVESDAAAS